MIVTVVYARPGVDHVLAVELAPGATVGQAIVASGLLALEPELARLPLEAGVWNRSVALDTAARDGDRIEVYRPLTLDPKEARRLRAELRRRGRTR
jgi:hypothetical protein